jgi:hypothetical protein
MAPPSKRADRVTQVTAQLEYHRQRLALHQRLHGAGPSARLGEPEHAYRRAQALAADSDAAADRPRSA